MGGNNPMFSCKNCVAYLWHNPETCKRLQREGLCQLMISRGILVTQMKGGKRKGIIPKRREELS